MRALAAGCPAFLDDELEIRADASSANAKAALVFRGRLWLLTNGIGSERVCGRP